MTNTEFCNLKSLLISGCISERRDLIGGMLPYQLAEVTERLSLPGGMAAINEATWRYMAKVLAIHLSDALYKLGEAPCEMKTAAGGDLTAVEASIINGSNLQEIN